MPRVIVAECAGACYGVERALKIVREAADEAARADKPIVTLGPLIHNPTVVAQLRERGVGVADEVSQIDGGVMVVRSHGVVPAVIEQARAKGLEVVDATCPHVGKAHAAAARLAADGFFVVVVGEAGHPEVEGICAHAGEAHLVASCAGELPETLPSRKLGVVVQTTQTIDALKDVVDALVDRATELRVHNTICLATQQRQNAARELASRVDAMIVVGGRNSGNTTRLRQICEAVCPATHHIETPDEIDPGWFAGADLIGVTAGASTPIAQIEAVVARLEAL